MALTLTQTAQATKKGLTIFTSLIVVALILYIGYQLYYYQYYLPHKPKVVIPPEVKFGVLPKPLLPQNNVSSANYTYSLDTVTGGLPKDIPDRVKVYFIPQLGTTLLAPDRARNLANSLSFTNGPEILNQSQYRFTDSNGGDLVINLDSGNFRYERNIASNSAMNASLDDSSTIASNFKTYLASKSLLKDDLKNGRTKVTYDGVTQKESSIAAVTLWPDNLESLPIITSSFTTGLINSVITKGQAETDKYQSLSYNYWTPDPNTPPSTYPIKTPDIAFNELRSGSGSVVIIPRKTQVSITSVHLGYFETEDYFPYLEPVYVFEGDNFAAILPAVTSDYLK